MNVRVQIQFEPITQSDWSAMRSLAERLTNCPESVRVGADAKGPDCLVAEFTMPTEPQYKAVDTIDGVLRLYVDNCVDSSIQFPRTEAEIARAQRKAESRRAKRRGT